MKPAYTTRTITWNSNVTKFVEFKIATNKKNKQVNSKNKPKMRFDISSKKKIQTTKHMNNHKKM